MTFPFRARTACLPLAAALLSGAWLASTARAEPPQVRPPRAAPIVVPETPRHPDADAALGQSAGLATDDVLSYHGDAARTGWNKTETHLTPARVSKKFGLLQTIPVDGDVFAQPLVATGVTLKNGVVHDLLVVATMNNSVYGFDAHSLAQLWHVNLGPAQAEADIGCADVMPKFGIASTPAIRPDKSSLYVVDAIEPSKNQFQTRLHELDLRDGSDLVAPVVISPTATLSDGSVLPFDPKNQYVRAGVAANARHVFVSTSSHCDHNAANQTGWVLRYDATTLKLVASFHTIDTPAGYKLAAVWMSGFAPALDGDGHVFAVTGNGNFSKGGKDWGESVIRLSAAGGKVEDYFTPGAYQYFNDIDLDFGSGGVMLIPTVTGQVAPPMAVAMGKDATLYLLDQTHLGHSTSDDHGALQSIRVAQSGHGLWGGPAYWNGPAGGVVLVQASNDVLRSYRVVTSGPGSLVAGAVGTSPASFGGSIPVVSSNGGAAGTGVVWLVKRNPLTLEAYDAEALGAPIYTAALGTWTAGLPYLVPTVANGRVFVAGPSSIKVFGTTP